MSHDQRPIDLTQAAREGFDIFIRIEKVHHLYHIISEVDLACMRLIAYFHAEDSTIEKAGDTAISCHSLRDAIMNNIDPVITANTLLDTLNKVHMIKSVEYN